MAPNERTHPQGVGPKSTADRLEDTHRVPAKVRELTDLTADLCTRCTDQPLCHHCGQPLDRAPIAAGLIATAPGSGHRFTFDGHRWRELEVAA